jgi:hypothetical protein
VREPRSDYPAGRAALLQAVPGAQCSQTSFEKLLQEILFRMILQ